MTYSMTAFAREECLTPFGVLSCEIKTLNHRYLDISVRTAIKPLEPYINQKIRQKLARGRIECLLGIQQSSSQLQPQINTEALTTLANQMAKVETELRNLGIKLTPVSVLDTMAWSGVTNVTSLNPQQIHEDAMTLIDKTLDAIIDSRHDEGLRLKRFVLEHCDNLEKTISRLRQHYPQALAKAREKMNQKFTEINTDIDPQRLAQETALLVQKFYIATDIQEELNRLNSHIEELKAIFKRKEPIGRRLDFLMQELNREANTLSSKSADIKTTYLAVEAKTFVEQIREQIQNIE